MKRRLRKSWELLGMKLNDKRYFFIFDTNILHKSYKSQADFTTFSLNTAFYNCIEMINKLDIYERVEIAIPVVVWNELKKQIIEAHDKQILEYQKWKFPEYHVRCLQGLNYINYIDNQINEYKKIFQVELIRYWNYLFQIINVLQE